MARIFGISTDRISAAFEAMTDREKKMTIGFVAVLLVILLGGGFYWIVSKAGEQRAELASLQNDIAQIAKLTPQYEAARVQNEATRRAVETNRTALFSAVQIAANKLSLTVQGLQETGADTKGSASKGGKERGVKEERVRFTISKLSIDKLTAFLEQLEGNGNDGVTKVMQMDIKPDFQSPDLLNVQMIVSTWKLG